MRDPKLAHILVLNDPLDELKNRIYPSLTLRLQKISLKKGFKKSYLGLEMGGGIGREAVLGGAVLGGRTVVNKTILLKLFFTFSLLQFPFHSGNS